MVNVEEIYKQMEAPIYRYLWRLTGSREDGEELTQETFYRLVTSIHRFRHDANITTYLYKIALNTYREWERKKGNRPVLYEEQLLQVEGDRIIDDPARLLEGKEAMGVFRKSLDSLHPDQRELLILREWEGLTYEQIAAITGRSLPWVKVNLFRGRNKFRQVYQELEGI